MYRGSRGVIITDAWACQKLSQNGSHMKKQSLKVPHTQAENQMGSPSVLVACHRQLHAAARYVHSMIANEGSTLYWPTGDFHTFHGHVSHAAS